MDEDSNKSNFKFLCPNCGEVSQDDVAFLCNKCDSSEVKEVDGVFMCPQCFIETRPFQCKICESKEVKLHADIGVDTPYIHPDHEGSEREDK